MRTKVLSMGLILHSMSLLSFGQSRQDKTDVIITKLNLLEAEKSHYKSQFESLKYEATGNDSLRVLELEKQLSDQEIAKRISQALNKLLSDKELNEFYAFVQSSAYEKIFTNLDILTSSVLFKAITAQFDDVNDEINNIFKSIEEQYEVPSILTEIILTDKQDGFYATVNYNGSAPKKDIKLEDKPSLTPKDILEVKKVYSSYTERPEISITFTKEGKEKFYVLTKKNIGKPIAIVISKRIVSMPTVQSEIAGGQVTISGEFSEVEIEEMIKVLKQNR